MGQVKDKFTDVLEHKYDLDFIEPIVIDAQYYIHFNKLIQVSCLATETPATTKSNIEYLAKKILYLEHHPSLIVRSSELLFYDKVKEQVYKILDLLDHQAIGKRLFHVLAFELIIYCQDFDRSNENDISSLADYIIFLRTQNFNYKIFTSKQKRLYAKLRIQYQYYFKRGLYQ